MLALPTDCFLLRQGTLKTTITSASNAPFTSGPLDTYDPAATSRLLVQERDPQTLWPLTLGRRPFLSHITSKFPLEP